MNNLCFRERASATGTIINFQLAVKSPRQSFSIKHYSMKETILITGASSGIGRELANELASRKCDLILVARNTGQLNELKTHLERTYAVAVHVFPMDLSTVANAFTLYTEIQQSGLTVTGLVNNAGIGMYGNFSDTDVEKEIAMINLNVTSVVVLTKLFMQDMIKQKRGRIMNVASLLSFLPFPYYAVYSATKSFILAFSETISAELEGSGVVVTTLCPGPVDTGFNTDEMWKTNAYKANKPVSAVVVARQGADLLLKGKGKKIVGFNNWFISNLPRVTPDTLMMKIKKHLASPA